MIEEGEEEDEIPDWAHLHEASSAYEVEPMHEASDDDNALDELGQVLKESREKSAIEMEHKKFQKMIEDHKKFVVPRMQRGPQEIAYHT
jgi:hypothetical protein